MSFIGSKRMTSNIISQKEPLPITELGDVWQLGPHRLMCGDSTYDIHTEKLFNGSKPTLVVSDPPYCSGGFQENGRKEGSIGTNAKIRPTVLNDTLSSRGYQALLTKAIQNSHAQTCYIFTDWRMWVYLFDTLESCGFGVRQMIVWDKCSIGMGSGWRTQHELIMLATKVKIAYDKKGNQGNVIQCKRTRNHFHPTQKPLELILRIIKNTPIDGYVYDPFCGSGTTLLACEALEKTCYCMELMPTYCDATIQRYVDSTQNKELKRNGKKYTWNSQAAAS